MSVAVRKNWLPKSASALPIGASVAVIGAGIAGASIAAELGAAGLFVTVFEAAQTPASAASGNLAGNCFPVVDRGQAPYNQWYWQAWQLAYHWWQGQENPSHYGDLSGAFKWSSNAHKQATWQQWVTELAAPKIAHWQNPLPASRNTFGVWFNQAGYLIPKRVVQRLLSHTNICLRTKTSVSAVQQHNQGWQLSFVQGENEFFDAVVIATGAQTANLLPEWKPFLHLNKGQVTHLTVADWQTSPQYVLSYGGYAIPAVDGITCVGATFEGNTPLGLTEQADEHNLSLLRQALPQAVSEKACAIGGHTAHRAMTTDHLPLVGQAIAVFAYQERLRGCALHPDTCPDARDLLLPNLWLNLGHGSRGLTSSFLSATLLRAQMMGQAVPIQTQLVDSVHPARVIFRQLVKNALI